MRRVSRGAGVILVGLIGVACSSAPAPEGRVAARAGPARPWRPRAPRPRSACPSLPLGPDQHIVHALNRLGYGPRPGDVERVRRMGLARVDRAPARARAHPGPPRGGGARGLPGARHERGRARPRVSRRPTRRRVQRLQSGEMSPQEMREIFRPSGGRRHRRAAAGRQAHPRGPLRAAARGSDGRLLVQPLQRVRAQGRGAVDGRRLRARRRSGRTRSGGSATSCSATAQHPAMLFYLDNWLSARAADLVVPAGRTRPALGLNENYARELMELHTLGVDGGYTQQDVIEVARCFTGWTIDRPRSRAAASCSGPRAHDHGAKRVLGQRDPGRRRRAGRRSGDRHPVAAPRDRAVHRHQARAPLREPTSRRRPSWSARPRPSATPTATSARSS